MNIIIKNNFKVEKDPRDVTVYRDSLKTSSIVRSGENLPADLTVQGDFLGVAVNANSARAFNKTFRITYPYSLNDQVTMVLGGDIAVSKNEFPRENLVILTVPPGAPEWQLKISNAAVPEGKAMLEDPSTVTVGDDDQ
jgi:hypothetical protein